MPTRKPIRKKAPSTRASRFVAEEMHELKHKKRPRAKSRKQAIAIGLSRARRAGIPVKGRKKAA